MPSLVAPKSCAPTIRCPAVDARKRRLSPVSAMLMLMVLMLPFTASAQPSRDGDIQQGLSAEKLRATGLDTLTAAQLDALNALLRERQATAAARAGERQADERQAGQAQSGAAPGGGASVGDSRRDDGSGERRLLGFTDAPIESRLKGTVSEWDVGTVFELENGQQWKVLKGKARLYKPLTAPQVKVVPGLTGRWFLEVDPDVAKPRVYLIN